MTQLFYLLDIQRNTQDLNSALNRYWFDNPTGTNVTAQEVAESFVSSWVNVARSIQSTEWVHNAIYVKEVLAGTDEFLGNIAGGAGVRSGDALPDYNQFSFYMKPLGPTIRKGAKRVSGISDDDQNNNASAGSVNNFLPLFALMLAGGLDVDPVFLFHVVTRYIDGAPPSYLVSPVNSAVYRQLSTQRSRLLSNSSAAPSFVGLTAEELTATNLSGFVETDYQTIVDDLAALKAGASPMGEHTYLRGY